MRADGPPESNRPPLNQYCTPRWLGPLASGPAAGFTRGAGVGSKSKSNGEFDNINVDVGRGEGLDSNHSGNSRNSNAGGGDAGGRGGSTDAGSHNSDVNGAIFAAHDAAGASRYGHHYDSTPGGSYASIDIDGAVDAARAASPGTVRTAANTAGPSPGLGAGLAARLAARFGPAAGAGAGAGALGGNARYYDSTPGGSCASIDIDGAVDAARARLPLATGLAVDTVDTAPARAPAQSAWAPATATWRARAVSRSAASLPPASATAAADVEPTPARTDWVGRPPAAAAALGAVRAKITTRDHQPHAEASTPAAPALAAVKTSSPPARVERQAPPSAYASRLARISRSMELENGSPSPPRGSNATSGEWRVFALRARGGKSSTGWGRGGSACGCARGGKSPIDKGCPHAFVRASPLGRQPTNPAQAGREGTAWPQTCANNAHGIVLPRTRVCP